MIPNQKLMTEKEISYVSLCFTRNIKHTSVGLPLDKIFRGEQISYDTQDTKKEVKQIFGKMGKRSKKWQRSAANTKTNFLCERIALSELFDTNAILKFVVLDSESKSDLQESSLAYFDEHFSSLISNKQTFVFLHEFLEICSESMQSNVLELLVKRISEVEEIEYFQEFLSKISRVNFSREKCCFDSLWTSSPGYIMAEFLLKNDVSIFNNMLSSFLSCDFVSANCFLYSFVNHLSYCIKNPYDFDKLVKKLKNINNLNKDKLNSILKAKM